MNHTLNADSRIWGSSTDSSQPSQAGELLAGHHRAGRIFARALDQATLDLPDDIERRLAFARQKALQHARTEPVAPWLAGSGTGSARSRQPWLNRLQGWSHIVPALALLVGLMATSHLIEKRQVAAAAAIDAALLTDDLPPQAYADPGFIEFLKQGPTLESLTAGSEAEVASPTAASE